MVSIVGCGGGVSEEKEEAESGPRGHKRKSWPHWRIVLTDFVIVVLGVGVAMAAQQAVEKMHDNRRAAEARASIRQEIEENILVVDLRAATEACIGKRLDEANELIAAYSDGKPSKAVIWIGKPRPWALVDDRYKAASQSGAVGLFNGEEQAQYGALYTLFATYFQFELKEGEAWADLRMLEDQPPPSQALDVKLRSTIKQARWYRWSVQELTRNIRSVARNSGFVRKPVPKLGLESTCLPVRTPRAEALRMLASDRSSQEIQDEP